MTKPLSYADSGVSIDAGDELVERIKPFAKKTLIPGVLGSIGGFGALFEISKDYKEPVLVTGTDGVGTKLKLAFLLNLHDTVGQDLVGMSVNDTWFRALSLYSSLTTSPAVILMSTLPNALSKASHTAANWPAAH